MKGLKNKVSAYETVLQLAGITIVYGRLMHSRLIYGEFCAKIQQNQNEFPDEPASPSD
jgi:hypothetical protein